MPSPHENLHAFLDDPHEGLSEWFAHRSGTDGPVQHLAFLSLFSQKTQYPFSLSIEDANLDARVRLVDDTPDPYGDAMTLLADSTPAGLHQFGFERPVISVNRALDEQWLVRAFGDTRATFPQRAVGTWDKKPILNEIRYPKVAILLDTDDRDTTGPAWLHIIRCRMDISESRNRERTLQRLSSFSARLMVNEAEWKAKCDACKMLVQSISWTNLVEMPGMEQCLPDRAPDILPARAEQLFKVAANIALFRFNSRGGGTGKTIGSTEDLRAARNLLLAARVVEDRGALPDRAVDMLAILGATLPKLGQQDWHLNDLERVVLSMSESEWHGLEASLVPPRKIQRHQVDRTLRRHLKTLKEFGIVIEAKVGGKSLWRLSSQASEWLSPRSIFNLFKLDGGEGDTP
jgi:hypothetical protein